MRPTETAGIAVMVAGVLVAVGSAGADERPDLGVLLAAAFVVLGATIAMPATDESWQRAGLLSAALTALLYLSWTYPSGA